MIIITVVAERKTPRQLTDSKQGRTETQTNETETANPEAKTKRSEPSASLSQNSLEKRKSFACNSAHVIYCLQLPFTRQ